MRIISKHNVKRGARDVLPSARFGVVFGLIFGLIFGYQWLNGRCDLLSKEIKQLEEQRTTLEKQYADEVFRSEEKARPDAIEDMMSKRGIVMNYPLREQVVRRQYVNRRKIVFDGGSAYVLNRTKPDAQVVHE